MQILLIIYGILGIATFVHVFDLGYKTGLVRTLNYIGDPEIKKTALRKREFLTRASLVLGVACILSLLLVLLLYGEKKHLFINMTAVIATPVLIFILPYGVARKKPYKWEGSIETPPPVGMTFE